MAVNPSPTATLDDVVRRMAELYPPTNARVTREGRPMSENGVAYVPRSEFQFFEREFQRSEDANRDRFNALESKMDASHSAIMGRLDTLQSSGGGFETFMKWALPVVVVLGTAIGGLVKMNIDTNVQDVRGLVADVAVSVKDLTNNTVGRNELDYRINGNRDAIRTATEVQANHSQQIASLVADARNLHDDVERMKGEIVTRRENEGHWEDFQNRLNLISTRINDLAKSTGGGELSEQVRDLRSQFQVLQNRFIVGPTDAPSSGK